MKTLRARRLVLAISGAIALLPFATGQSLTNSGGTSSVVVSAPQAVAPAQFHLTYTRPAQKAKLNNYLFDGFGPYPIVEAALAAAVSQKSNTPPEWGQGASGYGRRFGSDLGIAAVSTTARYALAQAFREDTLYYSCECKGAFARLGHALFSTFTSRRGGGGHRVFSFPSLVAPYAGTMTAVYAWYPSRFSAEDGLRLGNYNLLGVAAGNIAMEFFGRGLNSWLVRMHLNNLNGAPDRGTNP